MNFRFKNLVLFSFPFIISCASPGADKTIEMEFNVDTTLVDRQISDSLLSIRFIVPGSWRELQPSDSALRQLGSSNIRVSKILQNPNNTVVFSLTDVHDVPDSVFRNMDMNYKSILNPASVWTNVDRAEFMTSGYNVKQYVMSRAGQTFFKMVFGNGQHASFQIDYSILIDSAYTLHTKTLESIVGSLKRDH